MCRWRGEGVQVEGGRRVNNDGDGMAGGYAGMHVTRGTECQQ